MEIKELGEFAFIDRLTSGFSSTAIKGIGDDAAVMECGDKYKLVSTDMLLEGVHFDLTYTPLRHLGYKCVVVGISDIIAMNGVAKYITVSIGLSKRFSVENVEELYSGIKIACDQYGVELIGGDTSASLTGLALSITAIGEVEKDKITYRKGAKANDLVCVSGNLGAALLGTKLLEREKYVLDGNNSTQPKLDGYEYCLARALKPKCRKDIISRLSVAGVVPTSMIDISDGLASELLHICKASDCGVDIYLDRLPIDAESEKLGDELNYNPIVSAMNGGEDYELLFTVSIDDFDKISSMDDVTVIGHITPKADGAILITPDGGEIAIEAQGWSASK